jgi:sterol desaturase/sphingolipid hydroxylase (fatty acid hydroxylase superfamily)
MLVVEATGMRLSRTAYYADFAIYAATVILLTAGTAVGSTWTQRLHWLAAFAVGAATWTLLEYLLHCFVLHGRSIFAPLHAVHHEAPRAFVGTPTWISLGVFWLVFFAPTWAWVSFNAASGLTAGLMSGFLWYGIVHHAIHYRRPRLLAVRLPAAARRHMYHHYSKQPGNFGVTIAFWDHVFGTVIEAQVRRLETPARRPIARSPARVPPAR